MTRQQQTFNAPTSALIACICVCLFAHALAAEKWSRQLEPTSPGVSDSFDWVPLAQPVDSSSAKDRSSNARVLTYSQAFPPNGHFGDLPKPHNPPTSQQQPFDFPYQFQRFVNQPQSRPQVGTPFGAPPLKASALQGGEPTPQSFFKFEMPFRPDGGNRDAGATAPSSLQTGYQIQHTFGGGAQATLFSSPLYNQQPVFPPEFHPIPQKPIQQSLQKPLLQQNYIEDSFPAKNIYRESKPNPTQQSLQSVTPQVFPVEPQVDQFFDLNKPQSSYNAQIPSYQQPESLPTVPFEQTAPTAPALASNSNAASPQDVQLLYVPYDTLYNQQKPESQAFEVNKYNVNPSLPTVNPYQINQFYTQDSLGSLDQQNYFTSTTSTSTRRPKTTTLKPTTIFRNYDNPQQQQLTTPRPKPKAHQPPLAMFLVRNSARPTPSDVVSALRHSNAIAVVDAPTKKIPEIFVGPAGMSTPEGYVKFELPYLSQLTQTRELREIPFFVAPLSYRTPSGFNKILLPEPHVGSIVINLVKTNSATHQIVSQAAKPSVVYSQNDINQYQPPQPTQRVRPQRVKQPSTTKNYYPALNEPVQKEQDQFEVTTQRATLAPTRGNKFNYFYNQDAIHEVNSPKVTKLDRPKKKRPQRVQQQQHQPIEQPAFPQTINNPYAQFQPAPNQIINDDIYKVQPNRPAPSTSTSTSTTTTTTSTTSTTAAPTHTFFTYNPNSQVEYQNANGPLYSFGTIPKEPVEEELPRFTTRQPTSTTPEEEYRMKQYFRQQDAFRNRPQLVNPTNPPFEQVQYTPVDLDYERNANVPSTTHKTTSTTKQRITFYSPSQSAISGPEDAYNVVSPQRPDVLELQREKDVQTELKTHHQQASDQRPSYNQNEIPDSTVEYDPNPYHVPSELPPLTPNLPGLVNNLQEKDKQNAVGELATTTPNQPEPEPEPEPEQPTRPTRRPINRVRKPLVSKVTSSVSYSETETSTRRPIQRVRRPFGSRATASTTTSTDTEGEIPPATRRPSSAARNPLIRNPNRIRYQPTHEERQSLRTKHRKKYGDSGKDEDLEYQRDVLKQNYPVIKSLASHTPSSPTAIPSSYATNYGSEAPTSETQQVYTVTPSNTVETNEQTFPAGMLEPMQIAQQYNQYTKDNFGPGYFPNQEDLGPTEPIIRNEINPIFTTLPSTTSTTTTTAAPTTTTEEPLVTTRRSPFVRRNYPRLRTTTTEPPTTTTPEIETKSSLRPRIPPRKVIRVRARTRRPQILSSTTSIPEEEAEVEEPKNNFRKINRFNHDLYENEASPPQRRRQRPNFQLDGQESQWSPALKFGSNHHFKPTNPKEQNKENEHKFEEEPEIVTIGPEDTKKADNFEVNVSASFAETKPSLKGPNLKPEKSFAELLEEVMGKAPEEKPLESAEETTQRTTDGTFFESQKTTIFNRINRRNKFKKLKLPSTQNSESFETAESQGLGSQLYNSLYSKEKSTDEIVKELKTTTPLTPVRTTFTTTTTSPLSTMNTNEPTTAEPLEVTSFATTLAMDDDLERSTIAPTGNESESATEATEESATRRMDEAVDDLESQPSIFSEVKRQLHDLFAIDESEDHAVTAALAAVGKRRQEYMNIKRTKADTTTQAMNAATEEATEPTLSATAVKTAANDQAKKNLMDKVVYATSTSMKVTSETEICYRGRCIRSEDLPANHKFN